MTTPLIYNRLTAQYVRIFCTALPVSWRSGQSSIYITPSLSPLPPSSPFPSFCFPLSLRNPSMCMCVYMCACVCVCVCVLVYHFASCGVKVLAGSGEVIVCCLPFCWGHTHTHTHTHSSPPQSIIVVFIAAGFVTNMLNITLHAIFLYGFDLGFE